ncbi:MAG: TlpA family protein disulfide reductase, partial [Lentisphaerae bacterium]|nr:TlpA family protein disulfide reductase [Lentisphaerota bacterium]
TPQDAPPPPPPVRDITLRNLSGEFPAEIRNADHAGNVQLVIFLRTDDAPCRATLPDWAALLDEFGPRGFTVLGAVVDDRPPAVLAAEAAELPLPFPIGLAGDPVVAAFGGPAAIRAIPTSFLIDRDGQLVRTYPGFEPLDLIREDIEAALDGLPLPDRSPPAPDEDADAD